MDGQVNLAFPKEIRSRNLTYSSSLYIDIVYNNNGSIENFHKCFIGKIPMMVKSAYCNTLFGKLNDECENDPGGYFLVTGMEKVKKK